MAKIRTILVDDHELMILGIRKLIDSQEDIDVIGIADNGIEAKDMIEKEKPDVVVLDIDIPHMTGLDLTEYITKNIPQTKIILHTSFIDEEHIVKGFEIGASGYVPKTFKAEDLVEAIRKVYKGEKFLKGKVSEIFMESYFSQSKDHKREEKVKDVLTKREIEVLQRIALGNANQEVADSLFISIRTVEVHKANIMRKLEVKNIAELVIFAIKHKLISV